MNRSVTIWRGGSSVPAELDMSSLRMGDVKVSQAV